MNRSRFLLAIAAVGFAVPMALVASDPAAVGTETIKERSSSAKEVGKPAVKVNDTTKDDLKANFVDSTEKEITRIEDRVSQLKSQRDTTAKQSAEFEKLDSRINAMTGKIKETKENLKSLDSATEANWMTFRPKVEANLRELQTMEKSLAE